MEIKVTITVGNNEPIEVKVDIPEKEECECNRPIDANCYSVYFDETSMQFTKDAEANKFFLLRQQDYANELLKSRGYLFLNEVLDMLGIPRTKSGQCVGWLYDTHNPVGDNYVDFGIFDAENSKFVNGYEKSVLLNFNVDGDILDRV